VRVINLSINAQLWNILKLIYIYNEFPKLV